MNFEKPRYKYRAFIHCDARSRGPWPDGTIRRDRVLSRGGYFLVYHCGGSLSALALVTL